MKTAIKLSCYLAMVLVYTVACSTDDNDEDVNPPTDKTDIASVIESGGEIPDYGNNLEDPIIGSTSNPEEETYSKKEAADSNEIVEEAWICTETEVDILGGTSEQNIFEPINSTNTGIIYPGNLLQYQSLDKGTPDEILVDRTGGAIVYDLNVGNADAQQFIEEVNYGNVIQAMNKIVAGNGDITPAAFTLEVAAVNSNEELALKLGLKVSTLTTKVQGKFTLDKEESTSSVLVKLRQNYYTMSFVKPTRSEDFFAPSVTAEELQKFIQPNNPATYISSVTYGRIFYMLYESTASAEDMTAALNGAYSAVGNKVSGSASLETLRQYNELTVKVVAYGGDAKGTLEAVGNVYSGDNAVSNLESIVSRLAESGDIEGGRPLSYIVNSVENPAEIITTNLATKYTVKDCRLKNEELPTGYQPIANLFENASEGGGIGAMLQVQDSDIIIFNKAGTHYAWYDGDAVTNEAKIEGEWSLKDASGPLAGSSFDNIGAAVRYDNNTFYIFNEDGLSYEIFEYTSSNPSPTGINGSYRKSGGGNNILYSVNQTFGDGRGFPYINTGYTAAARFDANPASRKIFFGDGGSTYATFHSTNEEWKGAFDNKTFPSSEEGVISPLFNEVGASAFISFGGGSGRWLFVNADGTELMEYTVEGVYNGPWTINE